MRLELIVEVIASATQKQPANRLFLRVASSSPNPRLARDELEGTLDIVDESEWCRGTIGAPPSRCAPDLRRGTGRRLDRQAVSQGLLTKLSEERLRINELTLRCLPERLFEGSFLVRGQFEGFVLFRNILGLLGDGFDARRLRHFTASGRGDAMPEVPRSR